MEIVLTQRLRRRSVRSLRAACNPRGLFAKESYHQGVYEGRRREDNDVQPIFEVDVDDDDYLKAQAADIELVSAFVHISSINS